MSFIKYPSIENHYQRKHINKWLDRNPELETVRYIISEKIHGGNMIISITKDNVEYGRRNAFLKPDEKFFDYLTVMSKYLDFITAVQKWCQSDTTCIRVYGELFGSNIQKGVDYGKDKQYRIFDIYIDDNRLSPKDTIDFLSRLEHSDMYVPIIAIVDSLSEALEYNCEFDSKILNKDNNICEGIVIKPYEKVYVTELGSVSSLKKKNEQ